jgi:hypothetical protein
MIVTAKTPFVKRVMGVGVLRARFAPGFCHAIHLAYSRFFSSGMYQNVLTGLTETECITSR